MLHPTQKKLSRLVSDTECTGQGNDFELIAVVTRNPAIAEGPRDAGVPVEIW